MGVIGLTTFIDKNTHLLHKHELANCSVVIDGNNLLHHVHRECRVDARFGGDYDIYRQQLRINFKSLLKCGVTPYVVLDGGYTPDNKKLKKCIQRAKERIRNAHVAQVKGQCHILPLLAYDTFIQTLDELDVPHVTCQYEADCEIAKLANKLECPVISNDSDFYIFNLSHGFLPLDYIDFNPLNKRNADGSKLPPFLHCQMYNVDGFLDSFDGLSRSMLPVLATLLGNDYSAPMAFRKVDESIRLPQKKRVHVSPRVSKVLKLICWLTSCSDSPEDLMCSIGPHIRGKKKFLSSVEGYVDIDAFEGTDLVTFFSKRKGNFVPVAAPTFTGFNGSTFPTWFLTSVSKGQITPAIINAAVLHRVIFLTQVEDLKSPTIYLCSEHIRKALYGILIASDPVGERGSDNTQNVTDQGATHHTLSQALQSVMDSIGKENDEAEAVKISDADNCNQEIKNKDESESEDLDESESEDLDESESEKLKCDSDQDDEDIKVISECDTDEVIPVVPQVKKKTSFEEYHRENRHLKKAFLDPILSVSGEALPSLSDIEHLDKDRRLALLLHCLDVDVSVISRLSPDLSLFMLSVVTWIRHASPSIDRYHLDCVLLSPILLHMLNPPNSRDGKSLGHQTTSAGSGVGYIDLDHICQQAKVTNKNKFYTVRDNLNKYRTLKHVFSRRMGVVLECKIVHAFTQLQSCMYEISNLNKILRFPLKTIQPGFLLNGTFLYSFYKELVSRPVASNFLEAMILKGSDIDKAFTSIQSIVMEAVGGDCHFADLPSCNNTKKRRKKSKGKRTKPSRPVVEEVATDSKGSGDSEEEVVTTLQGFDIQNKFALLTL